MQQVDRAVNPGKTHSCAIEGRSRSYETSIAHRRTTLAPVGQIRCLEKSQRRRAGAGSQAANAASRRRGARRSRLACKRETRVARWTAAKFGNIPRVLDEVIRGVPPPGAHLFPEPWRAEPGGYSRLRVLRRCRGKSLPALTVP